MFVLSVVALLYVWQHISIIRLGYEIKKKENFLEILIDEQARLESLVSKIESPANIEKKLVSSKMDLIPSKNIDVVHLHLG